LADAAGSTHSIEDVVVVAHADDEMTRRRIASLNAVFMTPC
jgi:hypothetical protein